MSKNIFNTFEYKYDLHNHEVRIRTEILIERLKKNKAFKKNICEVGIGSGDVTIAMSPLCENMTSIDVSNKNIEEVKKRISKMNIRAPKFVNKDIMEYESKDKYDHIILLGLLEHIEEPVKFLKKLKDNLSPNGIIHIEVNLHNSIHRILSVEMGMLKKTSELSDRDKELGHFIVYDKETLLKHVLESEYRIIFEDFHYLKPFPTSFMKDFSNEIHDALCILGRKYPQFASYIYVEIKND